MVLEDVASVPFSVKFLFVLVVVTVVSGIEIFSISIGDVALFPIIKIFELAGIYFTFQQIIILLWVIAFVLFVNYFRHPSLVSGNKE